MAFAHAVHLLAYLAKRQLCPATSTQGMIWKASMMPPNLTSLPVEVIILITRDLSAVDQLNLKMTYTKLSYATPDICFKAGDQIDLFIRTHRSLEVEAAKTGQLHYLICTGCGKVKLRNNLAGLSDAQSSVNVLYRYCIACCSFSSRASCFIDGVEVKLFR